jgi:hypothetical protein
MDINEVDSLTNFLYDIANKIVGNIGGSTNREDIEFALRFEDAEKAKEIWIEWVNAYKKFARYNFNEGKLSDIDKPLKIYWKKRPEIFAYTNGKPTKNLSSKDGGLVLYARLLISAQNPNQYFC